MKIVLTGGGTGGHIFPLIAVTREIKKIFLESRLAESRNVFGEQKSSDQVNQEKLELYYLGPKDEFGLVLLAQEGIKAYEILAGKLRRLTQMAPALAILSNIIDLLFLVPLGFLQSFFLLFFLAPDLVFSKGGYGSVPPVMAAWFLRIPVFLHESDIEPGLANQWLAKLARKVFVSFAKTEKFAPRKMVLVGNPVRSEIFQGNPAEAKETLGLVGERPLILVWGGSQGAQRINTLILNILPNLLESFEIVHQTGEKNFATVKAESEVTVKNETGQFYHCLPFLREEETKQALVAADLVVSRAGSGAIFEIAAAGKPSILLPYPEAAQDHQTKNAYAYAQSGATIVMEEGNLTTNFFLEKVRYLFSRPQELARMASSALVFSRPQAAREIAQALFNSLQK